MTSPKWIDPKFTISGLIQIGLLLLAMVGAYYGIVGRVDGNDKDISALQRVVTDIPGIKSDVLLLQNTMANRSTARDLQINGVTNSVATLSSRVDRVETSVDKKLEDIAKDVSLMQQDIAVLKATLTPAARPR